MYVGYMFPTKNNTKCKYTFNAPVDTDVVRLQSNGGNHAALINNKISLWIWREYLYDAWMEYRFVLKSKQYYLYDIWSNGLLGGFRLAFKRVHRHVVNLCKILVAGGTYNKCYGPKYRHQKGFCINARTYTRIYTSIYGTYNGWKVI